MRNDEIVLRMDGVSRFDGRRVAVTGLRRCSDGVRVLLECRVDGEIRCTEVVLRDECAIEQAADCLRTGATCRLACRPRLDLHFLAGPWDGDRWMLVGDDAIDARRKGAAVTVTREQNGRRHVYLFDRGCFPHTMFLRDAGYA